MVGKRLGVIAVLMCMGVVGLVAAQGTAECEAGFRVVEHAYGESCIPEAPERAVILDFSGTEFEVMVGIESVAYSGLVLDTILRMHPQLETPFERVRETAVDFGYPPNMEAILSAQPDLLITSSDLFTQNAYDELSAVVPTVVFEPAPGDWRSRMIFFGDVLGISETVDALLVDYDTRVEELRELLGDTAAETTVSLVRTFPDQIGLVVTGTAAAALLDEVGLARPESQTFDYEYVLSDLDGRPEVLISEEDLLLANADIAFVFGNAAWLTERPTWQALPVAQAGQVYEVGYEWWGDSLMAAHAMLDDLFAHVAGVESTVKNPFAEGVE